MILCCKDQDWTWLDGVTYVHVSLIGCCNRCFRNLSTLRLDPPSWTTCVLTKHTIVSSNFEIHQAKSHTSFIIQSILFLTYRMFKWVTRAKNSNWSECRNVKPIIHYVARNVTHTSFGCLRALVGWETPASPRNNFISHEFHFIGYIILASDI